MEDNNNEKLLEGDVGGAVCTADGCIGDFAPENVCVATDITPKRKKIDEFFNKLEVQMKNLKEGKEPEPIDYVGEFEFPESNKYVRKFNYGDQVRFPGDEEYVNLKTSWQEKRKPIHDKKVMPHPFLEEPNMNSRIRQERNLYSTFDDGREDDFLAWYEDHKKETEKPVLKESLLLHKMKESSSENPYGFYIDNETIYDKFGNFWTMCDYFTAPPDMIVEPFTSFTKAYKDMVNHLGDSLNEEDVGGDFEDYAWAFTEFAEEHVPYYIIEDKKMVESNKKMRESKGHLSEKLKIYDEDFDDLDADRLYLVVVDRDSKVFEGLYDRFIDVHGYVDDYDAFVLPNYEIDDIFDKYGLEAQDFIKIYELPEEVYNNEDPEFHVPEDELEDASWRF